MARNPYDYLFKKHGLDDDTNSTTKATWVFCIALGTFVLVCGVLINWIRPAIAVGQTIPPPITDYANYPANAQVPDGCDASGVQGVTFTANGGPAVGSLGEIGPLNAGDTVTMTWTGLADVCDGVPVVLAMKSAPGPVFDVNANQELDFPYAIAFGTAGQGGSVTYTLPDLLDDDFEGCFGQLDAVVGIPLEIVGPDGSFYSSNLRGSGPNLLISAWNGGYENCEPPPTTTTSTVPETTTTTTAPPETTTTTEPPATTTTTVVGVLEPCDAAYGCTPTTEGPATLGPAPRTLAATGGPELGEWIVIAACLIGMGLVLVYGRRRTNREAARP